MCDVRVKKDTETRRYGLIFAEPLGFQRASPYGYKVLFTNIREQQLAKDWKRETIIHMCLDITFYTFQCNCRTVILYARYVLQSPGFVHICMKLFFLATCHEVLSKPSISAEKLQSLVEAFENTGGDAAGVRYLCLGRQGSFTVKDNCREISCWKEAKASRREVTIQLLHYTYI